MTRPQGRLLRHLVIALAVKAAMLLLLWWAFFDHPSVVADAAQTAVHLGVAKPTEGAPR